MTCETGSHFTPQTLLPEPLTGNNPNLGSCFASCSELDLIEIEGVCTNPCGENCAYCIDNLYCAECKNPAYFLHGMDCVLEWCNWPEEDRKNNYLILTSL